MSEDSRRLEWERDAWNQRETLLKKELQDKRATIARQQEELGAAAELLEAEKAKVARLANDNANQYAELVELRKTAQSLAELEDIAADLANALPNESESPK